MITFTCDFHQESSPFPHFWEHTIGSGNATLALRADWQLQMKQAHQELGVQRVRFHGLLSRGMHTLNKLKNGELEDSFFNADQIMDFLTNIGMRPFVELSFMPDPLASGEKTTFEYAANVTPPKDYAIWGELIRRLVRHWIDRYGAEEVARWYFEVWNEPDREQFWPAGQAEYFKLYRYTAEAIKDVNPDLRVGGPATSQGKWIETFLDFCRQNGLPVDFVTTHAYPNDPHAASGWPLEKQLAEIPRGRLVEEARRVRQQAGRGEAGAAEDGQRHLPLFYTEWNTSSSLGEPRHDQPYAAAFIVRTLMNLQGIVDGYSFWTLSDIFEELGFPSAPFHGGFGLMTIQGIPKPSWRAYELLHGIGSEALAVDGQHETVEAWALRNGRSEAPQEHTVTFLLTNHALPRHSIETQYVCLRLQHAPPVRSVTIKRIDEDNANPRALWVEMGQPKYLDRLQREQLLIASEIGAAPLPYHYQDQTLEVELSLPPHAVAAVEIVLKSDAGQLQTTNRGARVTDDVSGERASLDTNTTFLGEDQSLDRLQQSAFRYLWDLANPDNGLIPDNTEEGAPASIAAVGMGLTAYPVGVERGFISREEAMKRTLATLRFFWNSSQSPTPGATTGYKGFYYHFLYMDSGLRQDGSEISSIDTACLLAGALCAAAYFDGQNPEEHEIRALANALFRRVDWQWMLDDGRLLAHGWQPEIGFIDHRWTGYSEALFLYILGLGASEGALDPECYDAWLSSYSWRRAYGLDYLYAGAFFIHQYSHMWIDFKGIQDDFMRGKRTDYFDNSRRATYIQRRYAIDNPQQFVGYGANFWGLTASNGPGPSSAWVNGIERFFFDYQARGVPYGPDDGTVAPWATAAAMPFAPEIVLPAMQHFLHLYPQLIDSYGCTSTVNRTFPDSNGDPRGWVSPYHYAIDQGPVVIMIENYRSGLIWKLMRKSPYIIKGLQKAGFKGGWLDTEAG